MLFTLYFYTFGYLYLFLCKNKIINIYCEKYLEKGIE